MRHTQSQKTIWKQNGLSLCRFFHSYQFHIMPKMYGYQVNQTNNHRIWGIWLVPRLTHTDPITREWQTLLLTLQSKSAIIDIFWESKMGPYIEVEGKIVKGNWFMNLIQIRNKIIFPQYLPQTHTHTHKHIQDCSKFCKHSTYKTDNITWDHP